MQQYSSSLRSNPKKNPMWRRERGEEKPNIKVGYVKTVSNSQAGVQYTKYKKVYMGKSNNGLNRHGRRKALKEGGQYTIRG